MKYVIKSTGESFDSISDAGASLRRVNCAVLMPHTFPFQDHGGRGPSSYVVIDDFFGGQVDTVLAVEESHASQAESV